MPSRLDAESWLRKAEELGTMPEGEGDPSQLLEEVMALLQQLHSEDVNTQFLHDIWARAGGWSGLRCHEATLRALANEYAGASRSASSSSKSWELLRPSYTPELPTKVATSVAAVMGDEHQVAGDCKRGDGVLLASTVAAEKYVLEREEEYGGASLWLDPGGNLETVMPNQAATNASLLKPVATTAADSYCVEALCKVECDDRLCKHPRSLCWHCWRREETSEKHPEEFQDLLSYARTVAETAAPLQRAAEAALRWPFLADVASATVDALQGTSGSGVLVLGGLGVSAVRAARERAAKVWIWEPRKFLAASTRAILAANELGCGAVEVVEGGASALSAAIGDRWRDISLIVVEGFEMDGLLGFGALKQLHVAQILRRQHTAASGCEGQLPALPRVLPSTLSISVRLADARVAEVSGFDFTVFARVSKAFCPFLSAVATNATSAKPKPLTQESEAFHLDLEKLARQWFEQPSSRSQESSLDWPDAEFDHRSLQMAISSDLGTNSVANAVLVKFRGTLGTDDLYSWGDSIFYIPPMPHQDDVAILHCFRNSSKIWFEIGAGKNQVRTEEAGTLEQVGNMPLHGPPYGHAFLQEWYLDMYRDIDRNNFYEEGLRRWVLKHRKAQGASSACGRVMDIGSGTGLLLFFALRGGAAQGVGVEVAPNLARMSEALFKANVKVAQIPAEAEFSVIRNDALRVALPEEERPDCLVTEMMDGSGFGENMVRVILHAKNHLLAKGAESQIVPRKLKIQAALIHIRLPRIGGVDLSPLEAFWGPTRALGCEGEFANVDLDNPEAGDCDDISEVVDVWDVDFAKTPEEIAEALRSRIVEFPLLQNNQPGNRIVNSVAWWFDSRLDEDENDEEPPPILTNVPIRLRQGNVGGGTHWHQAVAAVGPFECDSRSSFALKAYTDGKKVTWTSQEAVSLTPAVQNADALRETWLEAARKAEEHAQRTIWQRQRMAEEVGDAPRVAALQAAAMHVGVQPGLFGVFGGASVGSHILKEWFGAGCSAGF